jgi:hypothetical protein
MSDLFGTVIERAPFTDIRNQRESVAEEKARLCGELNSLLRRTPPPEKIATIQLVTAYKHTHATSLKTLRSPRSSRTELQSAISSMREWMGC